MISKEAFDCTGALSLEKFVGKRSPSPEVVKVPFLLPIVGAVLRKAAEELWMQAADKEL